MLRLKCWLKERRIEKRASEITRIKLLTLGSSTDVLSFRIISFSQSPALSPMFCEVMCTSLTFRCIGFKRFVAEGRRLHLKWKIVDMMSMVVSKHLGFRHTPRS